jgi:hypothetical protein
MRVRILPRSPTTPLNSTGQSPRLLSGCVGVRFVQWRPIYGELTVQGTAGLAKPLVDFRAMGIVFSALRQFLIQDYVSKRIYDIGYYINMRVWRRGNVLVFQT